MKQFTKKFTNGATLRVSLLFGINQSLDVWFDGMLTSGEQLPQIRGNVDHWEGNFQKAKDTLLEAQDILNADMAEVISTLEGEGFTLVE